MRLGKLAVPLIGLGFLIAACQKTTPEKTPMVSPLPTLKGGEKTMELKLTSRAFADGGQIPQKYTCDGEDVNPPLTISGVPENTQSLVLIVDDPDAPRGVWDHWLVWKISPTTGEVPENSVPAGAVQGTNSFGKVSWGGPCPPPGPAHRYVFKLYALDISLDLAAGARKAEIEQALTGHILAQTQLVGRYGR